MKKTDKQVAEKRWVFGNRYNCWYLVGSKDRDYYCGSVSQEEMSEIGEKVAIAKYIGEPVLAISSVFK